MEGNSLAVGWLVFKFMSAPHLLPNTGTVLGSELWYRMLDAGDLWHLLTSTVTPKDLLCGWRNQRKGKGTQRRE